MSKYERLLESYALTKAKDVYYQGYTQNGYFRTIYFLGIDEGCVVIDSSGEDRYIYLCPYKKTQCLYNEECPYFKK